MSDDSVFSALPDEHYAAIGRVTEHWAALELLIDASCWELALVDSLVGTCLTAQVLGHARKLDAFIALVRLRGGDEQLIKRLNKFSETARRVSERRNRVVHDPWMTFAGAPHRYEASARKAAVLRMIPMATADVTHLSDQIDDLWGNFHALREETRALLPERDRE